MIPDFPHNIRIRLAQLKKMFHPDVALSLPVGCLSLAETANKGQRQSNIRMQKKNFNRANFILIL